MRSAPASIESTGRTRKQATDNLARLKPLWLDLAGIAARVRASDRLFVASDYDGTLAGIRPRPEIAGLEPRTRRALRALVRMPRTRVALLSGRTLEDLRAIVRVPGLCLSGTVGLETQDANGRRRDHVPARQRVPQELRDALTAWCARFPGAWLEDKRMAVAAHFRQVPEALQRRFVAGARARVRRFGDRVRSLEGKKVLEVLPAGDWNKASAFARWHRTRRELPIFLGDDEHDEPVHALVRARGGIAIAVGRERSRAEYVLGTTREVTWWLEWLAREWRESRR
jgi:trehalose 6-phosphate phosphatase